MCLTTANKGSNRMNKERTKIIRQIKENISSLQNKINRFQEKKGLASSKLQSTLEHWDDLIETAERKHKIHIESLENCKNKSIRNNSVETSALDGKINTLQLQLKIELEHLENQEKLAQLQD